MYEITRLPNVIDIGYTGEKKFRVIEIDMTKWMTDMPNGIPSIVHIRPGETISDAYIAATTFENNILRWEIQLSDVGTTEGAGRAQVWLEETTSDTVAKRGKSAIFTTRIHGAVNDASEIIPAAQEAWITQMTALKDATVLAKGAAESAADTASAAAISAEAAVTHEPQIVDGEWYVWDRTSGAYVNTHQQATGDPGEDGQDGEDGHSPYVDSTTGHWFEWNDTQGDYVDTGRNATGERGEQGPKGATGDPAPASAVAGAVADWMDEHITPDPTTVIDDTLSVTGAAADSKAAGDALRGKADAIIEASSEKFTFSDTELDGYGDYEITSDADGYSNVYVALAEDICPGTDAGTTTDGIFSKLGGVNKCHIEGSPTANKNYWLKANNSGAIVPKETISQGDVVRLEMYVDGSISAAGSGTEPGKMTVELKYTDNSTESFAVDFTLAGGAFTGTKTVGKQVASMGVGVTYRKDYTYDVDVIFAIVRNTSFSSVSVPSSGKVSFTRTEVGSNGFTIMPTAAIAKHKISIEDYVEDHVPEDMLTKEDLMYLSPEMYGAKGDGVTNDATAIQNCINAAITAGVPVRGYGKYKIGAGIDIVASDTSIYLHSLLLSAGTYAVTMTGRNNIFYCDTIDTYSVTGACGFRLATASSEVSCHYNEIHIGRIEANTNAIEFVNGYAENEKRMYYNKVFANTIVARYGNCFYFSGSQMAENSFYGKKLTCTNGWGIYNYGTSGIATNRFYGLTFEEACQNGVYGVATLIDCRTAEMMNLRRSDNNAGILFYADGGGIETARLMTGFVDYVCVDVSNADSLAESKDIVKAKIEGGATKISAFDSVFLRGDYGHVVGPARRLWNSRYNSGSSDGERLPDGHIIVYFNRKGYIPDNPVPHDITVSSYTPIVTDNRVPTIFHVKANTTINLDFSYCAIGIKEVMIVQHSGYKAVVKDKFGTTIFDGSNQTDGTYRLTCVMTPYSFSVSPEGMASVTYSEMDCYGRYFEENEEWTVEKLNIL